MLELDFTESISISGLKIEKDGDEKIVQYASLMSQAQVGEEKPKPQKSHKILLDDNNGSDSKSLKFALKIGEIKKM